MRTCTSQNSQPYGAVLNEPTRKSINGQAVYRAAILPILRQTSDEQTPYRSTLTGRHGRPYGHGMRHGQRFRLPRTLPLSQAAPTVYRPLGVPANERTDEVSDGFEYGRMEAALSEFINADCMEYLPKYEDGYFDLAITDPPYGGGSSTRGGGRFDAYSKREVFKNGRDMVKEISDGRGFL